MEKDILDCIEPVPKKKKYTIRMDITFEQEISQEEAERKVYGVLRSVGVKAHRGGID